jgi:hypothetical protein
VKSYAPAEFWRHYDLLPAHAQKLADRTFEFFKRDPLYPVLHLQRIRGDVCSVRVGDHYRAMAKRIPGGWMWFWIGTHEQYNNLLKQI